jgi:Uma2 family endonuclease
MATVTQIGPADHGRALTLEEFLTSDYEEGYHYEIIDGKLYVTHMPDPSEDISEQWLLRRLYRYSEDHPEILNYVTNKSRMFVPGHRRPTAPEPDLAGYRDFPLHLPPRQIRWREVSPILVGEVLSPNHPEKDLVRNVELYLQVPSIREYWILDGREVPHLTVRRRRGQRWQVIEVAFGEPYATRLLPGFKLLLNPYC